MRSTRQNPLTMSKINQNNRYIKRSHLTEAKVRQIVHYFSMDMTAIKTAELAQSIVTQSIESIGFYAS